MYNIEISPSALKALERLKKGQKNIADRIASNIDRLKSEPYSGKKLLGELSNFRSLRAGGYRILYTIIEKRILIQVLKIAHRKGAYRQQ